jgi:hypothetical protein
MYVIDEEAPQLEYRFNMSEPFDEHDRLSKMTVTSKLGSLEFSFVDNKPVLKASEGDLLSYQNGSIVVRFKDKVQL